MLLTAKQRLVYRMVRREGTPQKQVAARLRISEPAVSRLLSRAEDRVRELLRVCGGGGECGALDVILR